VTRLGTGTPEPGGITGRELLDAVRRIAVELPVVGVDVVEVAPAYDAAEITSFLANRVVLEMLSGIAYRRTGGTWKSIPKTLLEGRVNPSRKDGSGSPARRASSAPRRGRPQARTR